MGFSIRAIIVVMSILAFLPICGQESYPDCTNPKIIAVPLSDNISNGDQDEIYYQPADKYTYWYKLVVTADCQVSYKLNMISDEDLYDLIIYNYKGENFCNDIVKNGEAPVFNKMSGELNLKIGETYYFGVLHLKGKGCGHTLFLDSRNRNTTIKSIQNECFEEAMAAVIEEDPQKEEVNDLLKVMVINNNTGENISAVVNIVDKSSGKIKQQLNSTVENGFALTSFTDKELIVSIKKLGYEDLLDTIEIIDNNIVVGLDPIKIGDKLIMRKIHFHPNTYVLKDESIVELKKLNQFMLENSGYVYEIQGHTNGNRNIKETAKYANKGEDWNFTGSAKKLSKLRAEKIKDYMVEHGVKESQLQTVGYGGNRMIIDKPKNMQQAMKNIRVEVIVIQ